MNINIFYADTFWCTNVIMNGAILLIVGQMQKKTQGKYILRTIGSSAVGATIELALILMVRKYFAYLILSHFVVIPFMVFGAFGRQKPVAFLQSSVIGYLVAILLGGIGAALEHSLGISNISMLLAVVGVLLGKSCFGFLYRYTKNQKRMYRVTLRNHGKTVVCEGLLDTGNLLREPQENRPVHIAAEQLFIQLEMEGEQAGKRIAYRALGTEEGNIVSYEVEEMEVQTGEGAVRITPALLARAKNDLFDGKKYSLILHADTLERSIV